MNNILFWLSKFCGEHQRCMIELSLFQGDIDGYKDAHFYAVLIPFCEEVGAHIRLSSTQRRGVSLYSDLYAVGCALLPEGVAHTDLIHALLLIFINQQGVKVANTKGRAHRKSGVIGRLVRDTTLIQETVDELRRLDWLDVEALEPLFSRADIFQK